MESSNSLRTTKIIKSSNCLKFLESEKSLRSAKNFDEFYYKYKEYLNYVFEAYDLDYNYLEDLHHDSVLSMYKTKKHKVKIVLRFYNKYSEVDLSILKELSKDSYFLQKTNKDSFKFDEERLKILLDEGTAFFYESELKKIDENLAINYKKALVKAMRSQDTDSLLKNFKKLLKLKSKKVTKCQKAIKSSILKPPSKR